MGLPSSTFYYQPKVAREEREKQDADLRDLIELVQTEHPKSGYRTMIHYLSRSGIRVGERKLRRIMKKYDLHARIKRAFVRTTDSKHAHRVYPNLLPGRTVMGLNEVWTADLTYIRIGNGFVYLAIILDLYSRRVIGWHVSKKIDGDLAVAALQMAVTRRSPGPGCIHHSDRGVQYLCNDYVELLQKHGFWISNSAKGNPYDNHFLAITGIVSIALTPIGPFGISSWIANGFTLKPEIRNLKHQIFDHWECRGWELPGNPCVLELTGQKNVC